MTVCISMQVLLRCYLINISNIAKQSEFFLAYVSSIDLMGTVDISEASKVYRVSAKINMWRVQGKA